MDNIKETISLYDEDAYLSEFTARVLSCSPCSEREGLYEVILDRTAFFPEEGGQEPDRGSLGQAAVVDVQIRSLEQPGGDIIVHYLDAPVEEGAEVEGRIDFEHRFDQMQQHSGEHIFSGITHSLYGYDNVGFSLSGNGVTMDFSGPLTDEQVLDIEHRVMEVICRNLEIEISWPDKETLDKLEYRSKKELTGRVRIVTIPGVDVCACCAPHVRRTGEIGFLKVVDRINYKGGCRVSIECGHRALKTMDHEHGLLKAIARDMSTGIDQIADRLDKMSAEKAELSARLSQLSVRLMEAKIGEIPDSQANVCLFEEGLDMKQMQTAVNMLVRKHSGYCCVFNRSGDDFKYVVGISSGDAREAAAMLRDKFGARGGGSALMIQGSMPLAKEADIIAAIDDLGGSRGIE
ncbi:alanyl-tRNA editing protein [Butyrivibrio sp. MC2013]|uniref:alanyl-tRNA editing protein n=1 Tax=Butyrivibrio sp. MC2013 TaxID=1280686 RepID=UPI0004021A0C|nr:alanine--tRNA ligase-related protein [Butyrivibrio sp. MC2013]